MRQITGFLTLICLLMALSTSAQVYVNGVNINELPITYCQLEGVNGGIFDNGATVWIDYGQPSPYQTKNKITGADRKSIRFNSVVDALNFMIANGWELVSLHVTSEADGDADEFIYLMKKKADPKL